jgi:hypothetical protein
MCVQNLHFLSILVGYSIDIEDIGYLVVGIHSTYSTLFCNLSSRIQKYLRLVLKQTMGYLSFENELRSQLGN